MLAFALAIPCILLTGAAWGADGSPKRLDDMVYARIGDRALHINLVLPSDYQTRQYPAVIWVHGGGWHGGTYKENLAGAFKLFQKGFVTGSIEYRLSTEAKYPAQIHDCKAAIRFLRANAKKYGIDPDRIGVWGGSAGGHLVALLGTANGIAQLEGSVGDHVGTSSRVQAVCDVYGPTEFTEATLKDYQPALYNVIEKLLGGTVKEKRGLARLASPVEFASKDDGPMLIVHGDKDALVPISQSQRLYDALKQVGANVRFVTVKGAGHGFYPTEQTEPSFDEVIKTIGDFFQKTLVDRKE